MSADMEKIEDIEINSDSSDDKEAESTETENSAEVSAKNDDTPASTPANPINKEKSSSENAFLKKIDGLKKAITSINMKKRVPIVFLRSVLCLCAVFFAVYAIIAVTEFSKNAAGFSEKNAYVNFDADVAATESLANAHFERLDGIAKKLEFAENKAEVQEVIDCEYNNLVYFAKGVAYDADGDLLNSSAAGYAEMMAVAELGARGTTETYYNDSDKIHYISFFVPVRGSLYVDGICSFIELEDLIDLSTVRSETTDMLVLVDRNGKTATDSYSPDFTETVGTNIREFIISMSHDDELPSLMSDAINSNSRLVRVVKTDKVDYTLSMAPINSFDNRLWLVNLTENDKNLAPELDYVNGIAILCIVAAIALIASVAYIVLIFVKKADNIDIKPAAADTPEGCPGKEVFRINASKLLMNRERKYALTVFEIRQFRYIGENISEKDMIGLLEYIAKVIQALCDVRESYGYLGEGKFGLLIHIETDHTVRDRVRLVESIAGKNALLGQGKSKRKFNIGISMTSSDRKQSFTELLGYAEIACEKAKNNINVPYVIFNEQINSERIHNEKIESEMENALANGEFRLFLQPKYNVAADRIDSAEALVRWFDTEKGDYRFPGEFIGLFESNGFITKLDHFMYIETLKFLSAAAEKFDKIVPISVNVSMVTVSDPGFLDFYIENKKKYKVGDNFIVIEFTESFAMEDYQKIRMIVDTLHDNGIRCSLDDFGSGYSSLGTLKNIPFDEIKFDRLFLEKGYNRKNDDAMLETMFSLIRSMDIRVVQEGVETKEMFDNVIAKGCDVIQGYYYAKAIPLEEYKLFINSNTSIKYKSRVK